MTHIKSTRIALTRVPADDTDALLAALERDGGAIALDYLPAPQLRTLRGDFERAMAGMAWGHNDDDHPDEFSGLTTKRFRGLPKYSAAVEAVLTDRRLLRMSRHCLGERIVISTAELMAIGPGEVRQRFHRDGDSWRRAALSDDILFSANIALTEFHRDNGATVVVPGSHRWPAMRDPDASEICYAEMPAGAALLYRGRIVHCGGANATTAPRIGLYVGYIPSWLRPIENFAVTVGSERLARLARETQELLCYHKSGFHVVV
jgi:ectoine hydroxylase-related dioxygenase (phytanoyl-CoA dioxygenase family)